MNSQISRGDILKRIAAASKRPAFVEATSTGEIYKPIEPDVVTCFKNELESISGKCILCENEEDVYNKVKEFMGKQEISSLYCRDPYLAGLLAKYGIAATADESRFTGMQAGVTGCEFLVARTGSVLVSSGLASGRQLNVFPPVHMVVAHVSQLVDYPADAINSIKAKYDEFLPSQMTFITGPSRTADIEKTLVLGAHGPKEFIVFLQKG
ncbi:MAG TPA: LUD domain-containing protein [Paludibacter sp.]|nr:LUD domain-containing protein [Paludibacter sp.]